MNFLSGVIFVVYKIGNANVKKLVSVITCDVRYSWFVEYIFVTTAFYVGQNLIKNFVCQDSQSPYP
jgi:hypothetical protein